MANVIAMNSLTTICPNCTPCASVGAASAAGLDVRFAGLSALVCACCSAAILLVYEWSDWLHRPLWIL
jgi:ribonuclease D